MGSQRVGHDWATFTYFIGASLVAQRVQCLLAMWETWVQSLGREDPLEKEMAPRSSTLARKIPWMEERGRLQSMGSQRVGHDWATLLHLATKQQQLSQDKTHKPWDVFTPSQLCSSLTHRPIVKHRLFPSSPCTSVPISWAPKNHLLSISDMSMPTAFVIRIM